jgi:transcriptional regulator with XRE-family HTH domain
MEDIFLKDNIYFLRNLHKLSQRELAEILGVTPPTIMNWEKGNSEPKATQLRELSILFSWTMEELIKTDGRKFKEWERNVI